ncbi:MAG: Gfo/Idh/MocA family oxidoreductase [Lentisphaerae bacterium]|jgi:scyllo-inositol 2-dehydrogenase (NADP+)|nr:Gfo/Idh/MocA family oxidoreductase [Lentisphaerota bacterium]MBT5612686.1 Gfo/Idh/MocA family oxidoreductase [Lentisphaerota bacterium]MBT7057560.1 Gfo/Idh/MocA family oxidoreductase [Lentisphaerota bacterium]MBT7846155.1 Gfo/Idh/MocA family oxidoreductase [Lentisphaerota bacterium]
MGRVIDVGVVGCGGWCGNYHLPLLTGDMSDRYRIVGVCDLIPERVQAAAGRVGAPGYQTVDALIANANPELVYVVTKPPETHYDVARVALLANRHVFMEKPMCATVAQCDDLISLARERERILTVHHNRRWEVPFLAAQKVIEQGHVGLPYYVLSNHPTVWCGQADLLVDWGIHIADQCLRIGAPARPVEISCLVHTPAEAATRSGPWRASVRFDDGLVVDLLQLLVAPGSFPKWQVCGYEGACTLSPPFDVTMRTESLSVKVDGIQRGREAEDTGPFDMTLDLIHYHELLYHAVVDGAPVPVAPESARNAVALSQLLVEAAQTQRALSVSPDSWIEEAK